MIDFVISITEFQLARSSSSLSFPSVLGIQDVDGRSDSKR